MIQAIASKLESHSSSLEIYSKALSLLTEKFQDLHHIVTNILPATFQDPLTQATQELYSDLSMAFTKLSSQLYQEFQLMHWTHCSTSRPRPLLLLILLMMSQLYLRT